MSWRDDLRAEAKRTGISFGELLRQLLLVGATAKLPGIAKKMLAAHKEYYPARSVMSGVLVLVFCGGLLVGGHHHCNRLHRVNRARLEHFEC